MNAPIYLDYAATTPVDPAVARAMADVLDAGVRYGNAAAVIHAPGLRAAARVEAARAQVARLIGAQPEDVLFTSGATESNNLAILGVARANADRKRHIVTSRIEHKAVLDPCKQLEREGFDVTYVAPDSTGRITADRVRAALRADTALVSIMHVNNEIGVIQDITGIGEICRERGVPFHTDAAQSVGKVPINVSALPVDLLSFTAHKLYGPQGVGALYVRREARALLRPITFGGGQERGLRPGTLPTHQIVGFGLACELAATALTSEAVRITALRDRLWNGLRAMPGVHLNGADAPRIPGILNVSFEGVEGESLVAGLPELALTSGSACSSASGEPSYVLRALGRSTELAQSSLRFSFGRHTTEEDIDTAAALVRSRVERLRSISPAQTFSGSPSAAPGASQPVEPVLSPSTTATHSSATAQPDTLSPLARWYFDVLPGAATCDEYEAGDAPESGRVIRGEAGSLSQGTWVRFHLLVAGDIVKAALFQAYGCPHTLAVSAWIAGQLRGRARTNLVPGTPEAWRERLDVPVEKLGRLFVVEDALQAALQHWNGAA